MKHFFLMAIQVYWWIWPKEKRRQCLFRETCSQHVYKIAKERGSLEGIRAFKTRFRQCRPGYTLYSLDGFIELELKDKTVLKEEEISEDILLQEKRSYGFI